ncbi:hypothetical protein PGTUg99_034022 [Puccinia graminis f. sp. tritici]|uniref:Uncharacterized protein n=1 Tax=Puccinia graminis f. sp. tritici TaxID=56615 RepID=A0A5B0SEG0_PUCGR|nr:hypothetical protein PGTUg99_034022 [Puccinia graminis f. sp. tritici]
MSNDQHIQTLHIGGDSASLTEKIELKEVQEKLAELATRLDDLSVKHSSPPTSSMDRITCFDKYYPNLKPSTKEMLEDLSFDDRMIMCSSTIERNEFYQNTSQVLRLYESVTAREIFQRQRPDNMLDIDRYIATIQKEIDRDRHYKKLQSELLRMRLRRHRIEYMIHRMEASLLNPANRYPPIPKP